MRAVVYKEPAEFIWDKGNRGKNLKRHKVGDRECEEVFFDENKQDYPDPRHSNSESRKIIVAKTKEGRPLLIAYTVRKGKVRIISARDLNKKREIHLL